MFELSSWGVRRQRGRSRHVPNCCLRPYRDPRLLTKNINADQQPRRASAGKRGVTIAQSRRETDIGFAADSLLEEAVLSELVSEPKFPASWEYTGYFVRRGPPNGLLARNPEPNPTIYEPIP